MNSNGNTIFTVGHSDHTIQEFLNLLLRNDVSAVADVRSMPYSRFTPQFNRDQLKSALKAARLHYVYLGNELGARRSEPECYIEGKARYDLIARTPSFQAGLRRLHEGLQSHRITLLCAEKDPITCHRAILICRHLRPLGITISHILDGGSMETNEEMEERLLNLTGLEEPELFCGKADAIERAYDIQSDRIAYTRNMVTVDERGNS